MGDSDADLAHLFFFLDDAEDMFGTLVYLWNTVIKVVEIDRKGSVSGSDPGFNTHHLCHLLAGILRTH